jgi:cytochrome c oxidase subunit 3
MTRHRNSPFHLVEQRPWPLTGAVWALVTISGLIKWFHQCNQELLLTGGVIISEVFFFISFFWAFFHRSLSPTIELGSTWPPTGILPFNPLQIPLLNTAILLASGVIVTWAHHGLLENNYTQGLQGLFFTVLLGIYFTIIQAFLYIEASFIIADSRYGSTFFLTTGFHGLHVIIGTTFLLTCLLRQLNKHFSSNDHFGFEAAAWYWHFVDVGWLFPYISIYWWGR